MKLPEVIKAGILAGDWTLICKVYTAITGEFIEPPKPKEPDYANMEIDLDDVPHKKPPGRPKKNHINPKNTSSVNFLDDSEGEKNDTIASTLVENERDNIGQGEEISFGEVKMKGMEEFTAPSKGSKREVDDEHDGRSPGRLEKIIIPKPGERVNRFQDNGQAVAHERVDKNPNLGAPTRHTLSKERDSSSFVNVQCGLCGKKEKVAPILATSYNANPDENAYRCNKCCSSKRKRDA